MVARRVGLLAVVGVLLCMGVVRAASGAAAQAPAERVVMAPAEGTLQTRFVFLGTGFTPGRIVSAHIYTGDGLEHRLSRFGMEQIWQVQPDGSFFLDFVPALDFPGAPAGQWQAVFCQIGSLTCQAVDFDVSP